MDSIARLFRGAAADRIGFRFGEHLLHPGRIPGDGFFGQIGIRLGHGLIHGLGREFDFGLLGFREW